MLEQAYYLKSNVMLEPLVDQWYVWSNLIPPATAARNITHRHLKIMESYCANPSAHATAVQNPKLLGGPFIDYGGGRVSEIRALIEQTRTTRSHLIRLSKAIEDLDAMLCAAKGFSLEPLYPSIPEPLQGFVELIYDRNNNASFRLIEPLLYKSEYYDKSMQSLLLSTISQDDRPFVLSTPRLPGKENVHLKIPFDHEGVDMLFGMRYTPRSFSTIKEAIGLADSDCELFKTFLTETAPPKYQKYTGEGARWRYFGHACILFETKDTTIFFDPVLSYTYDSKISRYTYEDLPEEIDYVVITHNHQDHILFETLLQIRHRVRNIVVPRNGNGNLADPNLKLLFNNCGFKNVIELDEMEELKFETGSITAIPFLGEHCDLDVRTKMGYMIRILGHTLMFAADSCNISPAMYAHVQKIVGDCDVLFLGMECDGAPLSWLYGPLITQKMERAMDFSRRLAGSNYPRAIDMVERFKCKEVYVYAMGQEPWLNYIMSLKYSDDSNPIIQSNKLLATARERGIVAERLFGEKEILLS